MPERGFLTDTWGDNWFQSLDKDQKYLFIYLWTNNHCNQAGLYEITLDTIAFETKLPKKKLPGLLKGLRPKVEWFPELNLVWVKNFVKLQAKSTKFLSAVAKCLQSIRYPEIVEAFLQFNEDAGVSIPYQYYMDMVSIPYRYSIDSVSIQYRYKRYRDRISINDTGSTDMLSNIYNGEGGGNIDTGKKDLTFSANASHNRRNQKDITNTSNGKKDDIRMALAEKVANRLFKNTKNEEQKNFYRKLFAALISEIGSRPFNSKQEGAAMSWFWSSGFRDVDEIMSCYRWLKSQRFWKDKPLSLVTVAKYMPDFVKRKKQKSEQDPMKGVKVEEY